MKALLLAGGFGTRLRPLTYTRPKHLLPVGNRSHIEHVFDLLRRHEVDEAILLTSYLAEAFGDIVEKTEGLAVEVTHESKPLGTAGALKNATELVGDGTFLAFNGDVLTDVDLGGVIRFHRERGAEATILLTPVEDPSAYGVVPTELDGRVLGFIEKPPAAEAPTNLINAGVYVFEASILARIPVGEVWSAERQLFPQLVEEAAALYATSTDAYWMDIGTPEKYLEANLDLLSGRFHPESPPELTDAGSLIDPQAQVDDRAQVSSSCLGPGAIVDADAMIAESVLLPGARAGSGAQITRSILGEGAVVPEGVVADRVTLGDGETYAGG